MRTLYLIAVWLHILSATIWIGGMAFLVLVVVPWLRKGDRAIGGAFVRETGEQFRTVGWTCFAILLTTGTFSLWVRGVRLGDFLRLEWLTSPFGKSVVLKLALFTTVLVVSAVHDFWVGPRASLAIEQNPGSALAAASRRRASLLGRANVVLALLLVAVAVTLVRGWPG